MDDFQGVLEGRDTSGAKLRIVLNGDTGDITAGGSGRGGDLALKDDKGQTTIRVNAGGEEGITGPLGGASPASVVNVSGVGSITVGDPGDKKAVTLRALTKSGSDRTGELLLGNGTAHTIALQAVDGGNAVIRVGSGNQTGWIALSSAGGKETALLGGDAGVLQLRDATGKTVINLQAVDGDAAVIRIGGERTGWAAVYNSDNKETALLGGPAGLLQLRDDSGATVITLQAVDGDGAVIRIGGGRTGWAAVYNSDDKETALLGGPAGLLQLRDANGTTMIELKADTGAGRFGGRGVDGDLLVFGKNAPNQNTDQASVWIQGSSGDIILRNGDCAEEFEVTGDDGVEPGAVVALTGGGQLRLADCAYDCRVAGVISGAGGLRPGIVLGRVPGARNRWPLALSGKVFCKVDASYTPIAVGDLLTTSATPGHAMAAREPARAFGAVLGKAVAPLASGTGMIPILVALQ